MNKRAWINIVSVALGLAVVVGVLYVKQRRSGEEPGTRRRRPRQRTAVVQAPTQPQPAATPQPTAKSMARPEPTSTPGPKREAKPGPTATTTPPLLSFLTEEQKGELRTFLGLVAEHKKTLQEEMLPPVERLYQRDKEMVFRWADQADWPVHPYREKLKGFEEKRAAFYPIMPQAFRQLDGLLKEAGQTLIEAANKFQHTPKAPREFPPETLEVLKELFEEIDRTRETLGEQL